MIKIMPWRDGATTVSVVCNCCQTQSQVFNASNIKDAIEQYLRLKDEGKEMFACNLCNKRVLKGNRVRMVSRN